MNDIYEMEVSADVLAGLFSVTKSQISRLNSQGVLSTNAKNKYKLGQAIEDYIKYFKKNGKSVEKGTPKATIEIENARLAALKREKAELELEEYKGSLHRTDHIGLMVSQMIATAKQKFIALPAKLAPKIIGLKSTVEIQNITAKEIDNALIELADFNPEQHLDELTSTEKVAVEDEEAKD